MRESIPAMLQARREAVLHDPLAGRTLKLINDAKITRDLKGGEPRGQPSRQRSRIERAGGPELHEKLNVLLADIGRDSDHGAVLDRGMRGGHALDFPSRDVLTLDPHRVRRSPVKV